MARRDGRLPIPTWDLYEFQPLDAKFPTEKSAPLIRPVGRRAWRPTRHLILYARMRLGWDLPPRVPRPHLRLSLLPSLFVRPGSEAGDKVGAAHRSLLHQAGSNRQYVRLRILKRRD